MVPICFDIRVTKEMNEVMHMQCLFVFEIFSIILQRSPLHTEVKSLMKTEINIFSIPRRIVDEWSLDICLGNDAQ